MKRNRRSGFTLIEVLIVVVIMAVLAATIIPQFSTSTEDAKASQQEFNLHTLRSQIQLYKIQHNGQNPAITNNLEQLTTKTDLNGTVNAETGVYGPYILDELPNNPFTNLNTVAATAATAEDDLTYGGGGWLYNATTGMIWADQDAEEEPETP